MNHKTVLAASIAAAIAAPAFAFAAAPSSIVGPAAHPQCYAAAGVVYIRGAVATIESGAPVPDAHVRLQYGDAVRHATTDARGIYHAAFPRSVARDVREISTSIAAPTGTLIPARAREGTGACEVAAAHVGALQPVR